MNIYDSHSTVEGYLVCNPKHEFPACFKVRIEDLAVTKLRVRETLEGDSRAFTASTFDWFRRYRNSRGPSEPNIKVL